MSAPRNPAVAGQFYPASPQTLRAQVESLLAGVRPLEGPPVKAVIAPHAGYPYSGPVAASAFARVAAQRDSIQRAVLIGPSHRAAFEGIAASSAEAWMTPIGAVTVDVDGVRIARELPWCKVNDHAHAFEHSLEVQLPFLQVTFAGLGIVPLVVGETTDDEVAQTLEALWGGPETLFVVSSDLSHYHDYATACSIDAATAEGIESLDAAGIRWDRACGAVAIRGLLKIAQRRHLVVESLDLRNSGDTSGSRDRVVGYGAWAFAAR